MERMMCSLRNARDAILDARLLVLAAIAEHGELFGLCEAEDILIDVVSHISGEIANLPKVL